MKTSACDRASGAGRAPAAEVTLIRDHGGDGPPGLIAGMVA